MGEVEVKSVKISIVTAALAPDMHALTASDHGEIFTRSVHRMNHFCTAISLGASNVIP